MIEVWSNRQHAEEAARFVASIEADGGAARQNDTQYFDREQADATVDKAFHDGTDFRVVAFYRGEDIPCEIIPGLVAPGRHTVESHAVAEAGLQLPRADYRVEYSHGWHRLIGPDGEQVGKAKRSEDAAWSILDEQGEGGD